MARLLFKLRGVPEQEANEIRALLTLHQIDFYETPVDRWGVSMPAIWVVDDSVAEKAQQLLEEYHHEQTLSRNLETKVHHQGLLAYWLSRPVTTLGYIALIIFVLYLVIAPFVSFMKTE